MNLLRLWLFIRIVWRVWDHVWPYDQKPFRLSWSLAWKVSGIIHG
jgi:hypothetical protein